MSERQQPYVGVSGVASPEQQVRLEEMFDEARLPQRGRKLAVGIKAVHKTLYLDTENKYGQEWYPVGEAAFSRAVDPRSDTSSSMNIAQAYFDVNYVADATYRQAFLDKIYRAGQPWIDGIQFDLLPWHDNPDMVEFLEGLKQEHPETKVLLQCHGNAMEQLGPDGVVRKLGALAGTLDYVLFDSSHGTGTTLDTDRLRRFLDVSYSASAMDEVGMAVAGGLNGEIVSKNLRQLVHEFPDLSWDAEGRLHPINPAGKRPLDMVIANSYLNASACVLTP